MVHWLSQFMIYVTFIISICRVFFINIWGFPKMVVPQNGFVYNLNPMKMDDLGVPPFKETPIWCTSSFGFRLISTFAGTEPLKGFVSVCQDSHFWIFLGYRCYRMARYLKFSHNVGAAGWHYLGYFGSTTGTAGSKVGGPEFRLKFACCCSIFQSFVWSRMFPFSRIYRPNMRSLSTKKNLEAPSRTRRHAEPHWFNMAIWKAGKV